MCVLDWCKLFGERNGNYSWKRIVADPDAFKRDLLEHLGLDDNAFDEEIRIFREYRDKWVAHLDRDRKGPAQDWTSRRRPSGFTTSASEVSKSIRRSVRRQLKLAIKSVKRRPARFIGKRPKVSL